MALDYRGSRAPRNLGDDQAGSISLAAIGGTIRASDAADEG